MTLLMQDPQAPEKWFSNLPVTNRYTYGLAGEKFYRAFKELGKIYGTHCPHCHRTYVPATIFCEKCFTELNEWIDVGLIGELFTYTILYENVDGTLINLPQTIGFVKIAYGGLIHYIGGIQPDEIQIGMPLKAKFKPKSERIGAITDIEYFLPFK